MPKNTAGGGKSAMPSFWELIALLNKNDPLLVKHFLRNAGVDSMTVTQGLFLNEPVFIIGAKPNVPDVAQLWGEKQSFLPVKLIAFGRKVIYEKWAGLEDTPTMKYPRIVKVIAKDSIETLSMAEKPKSYGSKNAALSK